MAEKKKRKAAKKKRNERHYHVCVIEMDPTVLGEKRFVAKNPDHQPDKACLYVGMTGLTPEQRFAQHKEGYKSCKYPRNYGKWLRKRLYEKLNPMTYEEACAKEISLAGELRKRGFAVWQA